MVKKRDKRRNNFHKNLPGILWFVLGIVITFWTLLWLLMSMNSKGISSVTPVVLFGAGFYAMVVFIVGTLIYYICRGIKKIKEKRKRKHKKHTKKKVHSKKKTPTKKKKVAKKKKK